MSLIQRVTLTCLLWATLCHTLSAVTSVCLAMIDHRIMFSIMLNSAPCRELKTHSTNSGVILQSIFSSYLTFSHLLSVLLSIDLLVISVRRTFSFSPSIRG